MIPPDGTTTVPSAVAAPHHHDAMSASYHQQYGRFHPFVSPSVQSQRGAVSRNYRLPTSDSSSFDSSLSSLPGIYPVRNHLARSASDNYCMQMRYSGGCGGDRRRHKRAAARECHRCSSPIQQLEMLSLSRHQQSPYRLVFLILPTHTGSGWTTNIYRHEKGFV